MSQDRAELEAMAKRIGGLIGIAMKDVAKRKGMDLPLFALVCFTQGEGGWSTFISNAKREDMILALEEMTATLRAGMDSPPVRDVH